jgi:alpha-mannosidase
LLSVEGDVHISAVKTPEDGDGLVVRLSDGSGRGAEFTLAFAKTLAAAYDTDLNETILSELPLGDDVVSACVEPYGVKTILVRF